MGATYQKSEKSESLSRREFLKHSARGALGLSLAGAVDPTHFLSPFTSDSESKSRVVLIRHSKVIDSSGTIQQPILQEMLRKAVTTFTGKNTIADAWREFFCPEDTIGLKVNSAGLMYLRRTDLVSHYLSLTSEIVSGCKKAGTQEENIVVWDRCGEELYEAGFDIQNASDGVRVMGTHQTRHRRGGMGFSRQSFPVGDRTTHVSRILTDVCTALINIPVLKDHRRAGITGSLKNHYGSIDNPSQFHANDCTNPGIPEVNAIPVIRKKQRLIIGDFLLGVYRGGPRWQREFLWPYGGIVVSTDPVAVDWVMMKILNEKRQSEDIPPIGTRAQHLTSAEELGLGNRDHSRIEFIEMELG